MNTAFHPGELQAQALAGVTGASAGIRGYMPDQHRDFFAALPFMLVASLDPDGAPRAGVLCGAPGFVTSPDPGSLRIGAPAPAGVVAGSALGLLGLDFATRRRNRANGIVTAVHADGFSVAVEQSFGNCPKYIQQRSVRAAAPEQHPALAFAGLSEAARAMVAGADTFFVATTGGHYGIDISHRGGPPGFVGVDGATLSIPDFQGNRYFNTLGNLLLDPRAALLFIDDASGDLLSLHGRAEIVWDHAAGVSRMPVGRRWRLAVEGGCYRRAGVALRWGRATEL